MILGGRGIRRQGRGRRKRRVRWKRMGIAVRCWWNRRWKRWEGRRQESRQRGLVIVTHDIFTF